LTAAGDRASVRGVDATEAIANLFREAGRTHHAVYRITDGDDPDWASWYADWLLTLSELPSLLGRVPPRSHLVHALVELEREAAGDADWPEVYARGLVARFGASA
jgi:hypothetical protein